MRGFWIGLVLGLVLFPLGVYWYLSSGRAPVATAAAPMPFETYFAKRSLHAAIQKDAPTTVPLSATPDNLQAGAQLYRNQCAVCHGLPGQPSTMAPGMFPLPPQLFHGTGVSDDPPGETYWKVASGIRLTGMPSFKDLFSDQQLWQVSLLLAQSNQLPPAVEQMLAQPWSAPH